MSARPTETRLFFFFFFQCMTFKSAIGMLNQRKKHAVKTLHYSVTYHGTEPSISLTHVTHTQSHAEKSSALCSLAAEVQMVCLYASLTQCCSFTFALLCLLLLDSVHHSSTPDTLLRFALSSSLCHIFQLSHSLFLCPGSLMKTV